MRNFGKHTSNYDVAYSAVELREHDSFIIIIMNLPKNSIFKVFLGWLKYIPTLFFFYQNRFKQPIFQCNAVLGRYVCSEKTKLFSLLWYVLCEKMLSNSFFCQFEWYHVSTDKKYNKARKLSGRWKISSISVIWYKALHGMYLVLFYHL